MSAVLPHKPGSERYAERYEPVPEDRTFLSQLWDARAARVLLTALIFLVVFAFLRAARETLTLFLFAILFAYFLVPLVNFLERPLRGRGRAILVVYIVLIGALVGLGFLAGPALIDETKQLTTSLPALLGRLSSGELVTNFGVKHHLKPAVVNQVQAFLVSHRDSILGYGRIIGAKIASPVTHLWWLLIIPILSLFFLKQGNAIATGTEKLGRSSDERQVIHGLLNDLNVMLGSYIRAEIILASLTLIAFLLVLNLLRVPYAMILSPVAGFLEFIPVVGPALAAVGIVLIAVLAGYSHVLWLVLFLGCWRLAQDYVNAPRIMGKSLDIDPLLQIFAVLAGGEIAGVVGALIAVPVAATLRIFLRRIRDKDEDQPGTALQGVAAAHQVGQ